MNKQNIQRAINHIRTLRPENFDMQDYRAAQFTDKAPECKTIGCIVGHCTILDAKNINEKFIDMRNDSIMFNEWSVEFFGIGILQRSWDYMFSCNWAKSQKTNTIEHAIYRMERIIDDYKPGNIDDEYSYETGATRLEPGYTDND
ncbi:hypothetical protein MA9V2_213 [Chryseobacterium phage MA9V-2]|nr:hypothetical protein MA9V2_213 [Chryseobacterium phage MA9V-2]